jgi:nucleotide-binding universal stress UspA family protein
MAKKEKKNIVWSVDPFEETSETNPQISMILKKLLQHGSSVHPVYVLSPDEYQTELEWNAPWSKQIRPTTQRILENYLEKTQVQGLKPPQVIIEKRSSLKRAVRALISYSEQIHAQTILVGTHAKQGISRFFLGSFAETLLLHSKTPVLVVGPHSESPQGTSEKILFATDFSSNTSLTFQKVLHLAKVQQAEITLFHCLPHPLEPFVQSGVFLLGGGYLSFPDYLTQDEQRKRQIAQRYQASAKKHGITLHLEFHPGRGSTAEAIIQQAQKEKSTLITMAAESGPITTTLIGSITRQVVRSACCPVWVLRAP